jgi:arginine decarboxylase
LIRFVTFTTCGSAQQIPKGRPEPYYRTVAIGAYQEVMGNFHNLFGTTNEATVIIDGHGNYHIPKILQGSQLGDMLSYARYEKEFLQEGFRTSMDRQIKKGKLTLDEGTSLMSEYESHYVGYTYLDSNGQKP